MSRGVLLDLCLEQDRVLGAYLSEGDTPPPTLVDEYVAALAAHVPLVARVATGAGRGSRSAETLELACLLLRHAAARVERMRGVATRPEIAAELDSLAVKLVEVQQILADVIPTQTEAVELARSGEALELDEAFARIAGITPGEWAARVAARRPPTAAAG